MKLRTLPVCVLAAFFLAACSSGSDTEGIGSSFGGFSTTVDTGNDTGDGTTTDDTTTNDTTTDGTTTDGTTTDGTMTDGTGMDTDTDTGAGTEPLGGSCADDGDCQSGHCNGVPLLGYGLCSECGGDEDCVLAGTGINCSVGDTYFECSNGGQGEMCETDQACAGGLDCAEVFDAGGLVNGNFCSECSLDSDCPPGQLCAPVLDISDLTDLAGERVCINPGTIEHGQLCDADGNGDAACVGFCMSADVMGLAQFGICGECESDADCVGSCIPAEASLDGFSGSICG